MEVKIPNTYFELYMEVKKTPLFGAISKLTNNQKGVIQ